MKDDRTRIASEIEALREADGKIRPAPLVAWAKKHHDSALHKCFEWSDSAAADLYRIEQARKLIRVVIVHDVTEERKTVSLRIDRINGGGYRKLDEVVASLDLRPRLVSDALGELCSLRRKYSYLGELASIWAAIDEFIEEREAA